MKEIFVFGSNLEGLHNAGAAKFAMENHGALYGEGIGAVGNSYAIPTMMSFNKIKPHIDVFIDFANHHKSRKFNLTRIGTGIAGYNWDRDIRPMFPEIMPSNITILKPI
jgi:hypothetical protein